VHGGDSCAMEGTHTLCEFSVALFLCMYIPHTTWGGEEAVVCSVVVGVL